MCFYSSIFLRPPRSVQPLLILWPYGSFPAMGTNGDQRRLLLIEDPALEAQPLHEVAVHVRRNLSPDHDTNLTLVSLVYIANRRSCGYDGNRTGRMMRYYTVIYIVVVLLCAIPL